MKGNEDASHNPYLIQEAAIMLTSYNLSVLPVNYNKQPDVSSWKKFQTSIPDAFDINDMFSKNTFGIAIITGNVSDNLELLDEDSKYDLTGTMHEDFIALLSEQAPGLYEKFVIEKSVNGGYHYIFKCETISGNLKLSSRPASEEELKRNEKEKQKVLFETRGEGGYFVCAPTKGYEIIQGSFENITSITPEEREILFSIARSFDQCQKEYIPAKQKDVPVFSGLSPFEDYNKRGDVLALLHKNGWTTAYSKGSKTFLKRPGDTTATQSANFDTDKNWFTVFSTSTEFETQKAYQPYAVYAVLECGGDFTKASKQLYDAGYGDRRRNNSEQHDSFFKQSFANSAIDPDLDAAKIIINSVDLFNLDVEENRYLLAPIIPRIGTGVLAGMPDTGKSQFARQFCINVATDMNQFLDYALTSVFKSALYIATEDDSHNTSFLLQQQMKGLHKDATQNLSFLFADTYTQEEILFLMDEHLTKHPCDLVIVDSFGDVFKGMDTNNSTAMRQTVKNFDRFAKKHKCFILFVHHVNKSGYNQAPHQMHIMGGAGLVQKVRLAIQLSTDEIGTKYLTVVKGNYCPQDVKQSAMELTFDKDHFIFTRTGKNIPRESLTIDGKVKDTKFEKLKTMADEIFGMDSLTHGQFVKKHTEQTGKEIAQAKRDLKAMYDFEIVIKEGKLYSLNGSVNNMENPSAPEEDDPPPF